MIDDVEVSRRRLSKLRELTATGYSDQEIADQFGVHSATVRRWRKAAGIASGREQVPTTIAHGSPAGYRAGCREDCCRLPALADQADRRARVQAETARTAAHAYARWTDADDAVVLLHPPLVAAHALGRTYLSVTSRKTYLNRVYRTRHGREEGRASASS